MESKDLFGEEVVFKPVETREENLQSLQPREIFNILNRKNDQYVEACKQQLPEEVFKEVRGKFTEKYADVLYGLHANNKKYKDKGIQAVLNENLS